jgi:hypothetical protein
MVAGSATPCSELFCGTGPSHLIQVCQADLLWQRIRAAAGREAKEEAAHLFRVAGADCPKSFIECDGANAELKALSVTP